MRELLRTTDAVLLSFVQSLLSDAGVEAIVADAYISSVEGSIGAFPRRVLVPAEDLARSRAILRDADLHGHLFDDGHEDLRAHAG